MSVTPERLTLALHLGDRLVGSVYLPEFKIVDGEPRVSFQERFSRLVQDASIAVFKLVNEVNARADWDAADYCLYLEEEAGADWQPPRDTAELAEIARLANRALTILADTTLTAEDLPAAARALAAAQKDTE